MIRFIAALIEFSLIVWALVAPFWIIALKRRMAGLHEPELWLPRKERRAHARKLLAREDDAYIEQLIRKNTTIQFNRGDTHQ